MWVRYDTVVGMAMSRVRLSSRPASVSQYSTPQSPAMGPLRRQRHPSTATCVIPILLALVFCKSIQT